METPHGGIKHIDFSMPEKLLFVFSGGKLSYCIGLEGCVKRYIFRLFSNMC